MESKKLSLLLVCLLANAAKCSAFANVSINDTNAITQDTEINGTSDATTAWEMEDSAAEGNGTWNDGGCVNVTDPEMVQINATGNTPVRVGQWTLVRWGFHGNDWLCDLRGNRWLIPSVADMIDTLKVTVGSNGLMEVGNTRSRCNAISRQRCHVGGWSRRKCHERESVDYCFRLRIRCDRSRLAELEEEKERLRAQKWIMFGYGALSGFVIGCIISAIGMMCIDSCCTDPNKQLGPKKHATAVTD